MSKKPKKFEFSRLFVAVIILGFVLVGFLGGNNVVEQSKLRTVISEHDIVKTAIDLFHLQYKAIPGDFVAAHSYWGMHCHEIAEKCNGDGNGRIDLTDVYDGNEVYRAWQHLALANLYPGFFNGEGESVTYANGAVAGKNVSPSQFAPLLISLAYDSAELQSTAGNGAKTGGREKNRNLIIFGSDVVGNQMANGTEMSSSQVAFIDHKADDGMPWTGDVFAVGAVSSSSFACVSPGPDGMESTSDDVYNFDAGKGRVCSVAFGW